MIDINKNKGSGEFDDDAFDADFSDADFDEAAFDEDADYADLPAEEGEYEGDDFEAEDWGDEEGEEQDSGKKGKKAKKQKSGGGGGLSFNAIVIMGAVVLGGGVLAFNVMKETSKAESAKPTMFQSILGIGGIMDGTLFGDAETPADGEQPVENQGFLNDPSTPVPTDSNPPQPTPIAPADGAVAANEPLTPMPTPSMEAPRGPEDMPPTENTLAADATPSEANAVAPTDVTTAQEPSAPVPQQSAEDIIKQAQANREQRLQDEQPDVNAEPSPTDKEALTEALDKKMADAKEKAEAVIAETKEDIKDAVEPVVEATEEKVAEIATPEPVKPVVPEAVTPPAPVVAEIPAETKEEITANKEAVASLESKLDTLLSRMEKVESDLGAVREEGGKGADTAELERTVASLKEELAEIKARPVAASADTTSDSTPPPVKKKRAPKPVPEDEAYTPVAPAPVAATPKPAQQTAPAKAASTGRWELRAAQPGRAWVSKPGERDMQAISVGESLPGIGRISAITYMNGRWTVTGTQGSIQQ